MGERQVVGKEVGAALRRFDDEMRVKAEVKAEAARAKGEDTRTHKEPKDRPTHSLSGVRVGEASHPGPGYRQICDFLFDAEQDIHCGR